VALLSKFFGRAASEGAGVAIGLTAFPALAPVAQEITNEAWSDYPHKPPSAMTLAAGVAQGQVNEKKARAWAKQSGYGDEQFTALIDIANVGPGVEAAFELWRRGEIGEPGFRRAVKRLALEQEWIDDLVALKDVRLDPAVIATAVQRGLIANLGILPVAPPSAPGKVPPMPTVDLNAFTEAAASGVDADRLKVLARIVGLPASPDLAARMTFRGIIEKADFERAIAEGNTRNEWAPFLFEGFREIPTARDFIQGELRGWISTAERHAGTEKWGLSDEHSDLLFHISGRPLTWHQVWIGLQRGGTYDGPTADIHPAFLRALRQSNIRPEWYNLAWHSRYTYPSAFVMRALTADGTLTAAQTEADLIDMGWRPDRAKQAAEKWAGGGGATADPNVTKAQVQLWGTLHRSYVAEETDDATATTTLTTLGVAPAAQATVLSLWQAERALIRKQLTPAEVKKAYRALIVNRATGLPWTRDDAIAALLERGYSLNDANEFLDIPKGA